MGKEQIYMLLIVTRNSEKQKRLSSIFKSHCTKVIESGFQALNYLEQNRQDIILCDDELEDMPEQEIVMLIRDEFPKIVLPILSFNFDISQEEKKTFINQGIDEYIDINSPDKNITSKVMNLLKTSRIWKENIDIEMKILVVDDSEDSILIFQHNLTKLGFKNIVTAKDGNDAWDKISKSHLSSDKIDFILCDKNMPDMNGLQLLEKIKTSKDFSNIPFVIITSDGKKDHVVEAIDAGASNFIVKPITAESLKIKILSVMKQKK